MNCDTVGAPTDHWFETGGQTEAPRKLQNPF